MSSILSLVLGPWFLMDLYFLVASLILLALRNRPIAHTSLEMPGSLDAGALTILIPMCNNSGTVLHSLVPKLLNETRKGGASRTWIIDSSTDGSEDRIREALGLSWSADDPVARTAAGEHLSLIHLKNRQGGKAWAINRAVSRIQTPFFGIVDSDWVFEEKPLVEASKVLRDDPSLAYVQLAWRAREGNLRFVEGLDQVSIEYRHQLENRVRAWRGIPITIHGAAVAIRREHFLAVGGFDEQVLSEDVDLFLRLLLAGRFGQGKVLSYMRENPCDHWRQFFLQKARWAEGRSQMLRRYAISILRSRFLGKRQKMFLLYYLAYFGRCVGFAIVAGSAVIAPIAGQEEWTRTAAVGLGAMLTIRWLGHAVTAWHGVNRVPRFCRFLEPLTFYAIGFIYTVTFFLGLMRESRTWHVVERKDHASTALC